MIVISKRSGKWEAAVRNATHRLPPSFFESLNVVVDLLNLPPGWDSYSARQIAPENAAATIRLLATLLNSETPTPFVVPRINGNIQLEWHSEEVDLEVYIDSPDSVSFFAVDVANDQTAERPLAGCEDELKYWLGRVQSD